jgi:catechol 2,3-dioxygenase-like lactoylglutathione lyase family enzyme
VPSIQKALDFYCGVLGFKEVMTAELPSGIPPINKAFGVPDAGCKVRMIKKGNSCIELFEFNSGQTGDPKRPVTLEGITHFALASDDIAKDYDHLAANGVVFNAPRVRCGAGALRVRPRSFGNVIELLEHAPNAPTGCGSTIELAVWPAGSRSRVPSQAESLSSR